MKVAEKIVQKIAAMPAGSTFKYRELPIERKEYTAAAKAMERLVANETIGRITKGLFYKPRKSPFGWLVPDEQELLKPYLYFNGKRIAYITGNALYNRWGLTTQVPASIKLASSNRKPELQFGSVKMSSARSYVDVDDTNYVCLEILDAIKDFKIIPDLNKKAGVKILTERIKALENKDLLKSLALRYPPRARALTGALIELTDKREDLTPLKESLNPLSTFKYNLNATYLPNYKNWQIC